MMMGHILVESHYPNFLCHFGGLYFFMAWFFYKSGYFFNPDGGAIAGIRNDAQKLLKPFLIWTMIGLVLEWPYLIYYENFSFRTIVYSPIRSLLLNGYTWSNLPIWFLLSLFIVRQISRFTFDKIPWYVIVIGSAAVAYLCYLTNFRLTPLWIANSCIGLCFFTLGYKMKGKVVPWWVTLLCLFVYAGLAFVDFPCRLDVRSNTTGDFYFAWYIASFVGIVPYTEVL